MAEEKRTKENTRFWLDRENRPMLTSDPEFRDLLAQRREEWRARAQRRLEESKRTGEPIPFWEQYRLGLIQCTLTPESEKILVEEMRAAGAVPPPLTEEEKAKRAEEAELFVKELEAAFAEEALTKT